MMQDISCTTWSILALRKHLQLNITFLWQIGYLPLFPRPSRVVFGGLMVHSLSRRWGRKILPRTTMANKLIDHVKHWSRLLNFRYEINGQSSSDLIRVTSFLYIVKSTESETVQSGWCGHPESRCSTIWWLTGSNHVPSEDTKKCSGTAKRETIQFWLWSIEISTN